jgi:DNA-nicking Smr family endonuclease
VKEAPHRPHRLRRLSDEEIALWTEVARGVERRRGAALPTPSSPQGGEPLRPPPAAAEAPPSRPAPPSAPLLAPIERRLKRELARGRGAIDAALDLHGLTQPEAHHALRGFLRHSQARGARLVIVVTGKGGPLDEPGGWPPGRGVLRRLTPHWLRESDLRSVVLGFEEAGRAHGGSGALYVRLRRLQGPPVWE